MTATGKEQEGTVYEAMILEPIYQGMMWRHLLDAQAGKQRDRQCIISPAQIKEALARVIQLGQAKIARPLQQEVHD
jgi:hypothetical protein